MADTIGVIGAMDVEVELLKSHLENRVDTVRAGIEFSQGTLGGTSVVVARCGVGKVNAAICAQAMIDLCGVTHVVNTGIAGSLVPGIGILDLVVSTDALQHDMDVTPLGYAPGEVPGAGIAVEADPGLREAISRAARAAAPDVRIHEGRVVSGDQFIDGVQTRSRLASQFGGLCCEMEGGSIAYACRQNGVPFAVVRMISDSADGMEYSEFETKAAHHCANIVQHMLEHWA